VFYITDQLTNNVILLAGGKYIFYSILFYSRNKFVLALFFSNEKHLLAGILDT
jgi:hypothetical protein